MDFVADDIIKTAAKQYKRSEMEKFSNVILEEVYQSIIPMNKCL